jgi:dTDP-glucose 4,6-dehydratase
MEPTVLVTGGAGFIGSNFILEWMEQEGTPVVNLDKLTYAGNPRNLENVAQDSRYQFVHGDICDRDLVRQTLAQLRPRALVHLAAETHVDRSIRGPEDFVRTNIEGTFCLLREALTYWQTLDGSEQARFRFLHVSTDEVYGSLPAEAAPCRENSAYAPASPYAASKAAADHLVRAYHRTYGLPVVITNCANNYGRFQFPEKLVPLMILHAHAGQPLPVYGDGLQVRDWMAVTDHCAALRLVLARGRVGETYHVGGSLQRRNLETVELICRLLDELCPQDPVIPHHQMITHVDDRPGHDRRYALDTTKIRTELEWKPKLRFEEGLRQTVNWYLQHPQWVQEVTSGSYRDWIALHYPQPVRDQLR